MLLLLVAVGTSGPMEDVSCGAIPEDPAPSELNMGPRLRELLLQEPDHLPHRLPFPLFDPGTSRGTAALEVTTEFSPTPLSWWGW